MTLSKNYDPKLMEPAIQEWWAENGIFHYEPDENKPVYVIDTPPATVSGKLHLGHVYSYSHADFMARYFRMRGYNVYYPMGFDDNGLPTERLVEKQEGIRAVDVGRQKFIEICLRVSQEAEIEYENLWKCLGLSVDWRYTYRTIEERSRRISQLSFLDLTVKDTSAGGMPRRSGARTAAQRLRRPNWMICPVRQNSSPWISSWSMAVLCRLPRPARNCCAPVLQYSSILRMNVIRQTWERWSPFHIMGSVYR